MPQEPMKAKAGRSSELSRRAVPRPKNDGLIVMSAEEAFARAKTIDWPENFPKSDDEIDLSDIPEQDFSRPDAVRGRYRELALAAQGFVQLDSDLRSAFPDTESVNKVLRDFMNEQRGRRRS